MSYEEIAHWLETLSEADRKFFFQQAQYARDFYLQDVSNDYVLFEHLFIIPDYIIEFFEKMEARKGQ